MVAEILLLCAVVLGGLLLASGALDQASHNRRNRQRRRQLRHRVIQTDQLLARDHAQARRAMNDAAGQSWRNRFE